MLMQALNYRQANDYSDWTPPVLKTKSAPCRVIPQWHVIKTEGDLLTRCITLDGTEHLSIESPQISDDLYEILYRRFLDR